MVATLAGNQAKERCLGSAAPCSLWTYLGCVMAIVYFGVNLVVDGRPSTSPKHLVGSAVGAIVGGLVSGLVGGALMARWVKRH
jgi:hypothetical protein